MLFQIRVSPRKSAAEIFLTIVFSEVLAPWRFLPADVEPQDSTRHSPAPTVAAAYPATASQRATAPAALPVVSPLHTERRALLQSSPQTLRRSRPSPTTATTGCAAA